MAALTSDEKTMIRRVLASKAQENSVPVSWVKGAANDAAQAVEDALVAMKIAVSSDIDTATSPYGVTFTNNEKKWIAAKVMELSYVRDIL